jgi:hypothetical protein
MTRFSDRRMRELTVIEQLASLDSYIATARTAALKHSAMSIKEFLRWFEDRICMIDTRARGRLTGTATMIALLACLPACQSPGWAPSPVVSSPEAGVSRFSLRPVLDGEGYRPYFLGGYAGASYGPGVFGRRAVVGASAPPPASGASVTVDEGNWTPQ